ncbi:hypothetical protein AKO1_007800 [Acrasis kona]|uniref:RING-type domain-containing protein n=1 Tax=Acrasis kona TaxID=1008807 RepID=A0AAW2YR23_9EUKA
MDAPQNIKDPVVVIPSGFLLFVLVIIIATQCGVQFWKKIHKQSYTLTTVFLMWLFPIILILLSEKRLEYFKMVTLWLIFSSATFYIAKLAATRPLHINTPKKVYAWSLLVYKLSHIAVVVGLAMIVIEVFTGFFHYIESEWPIYISAFIPYPSSMLFYGLYFGVLVRDCAEIASDRMQSSLAQSREHLYTSETQQKRTCGICNQDLKNEDEDDIEGGSHLSRTMASPTVTDPNKFKTTQPTKNLACGHSFHEFCLKGWMLVGKKQECPYCKEKIEIKREPNPWEMDSELYTNVLEMVRYFTVWNPLIIIIVHCTFLMYFYYDKLFLH